MRKRFRSSKVRLTPLQDKIIWALIDWHGGIEFRELIATGLISKYRSVELVFEHSPEMPRVIANAVIELMRIGYVRIDGCEAGREAQSLIDFASAVAFDPVTRRYRFNPASNPELGVLMTEKAEAAYPPGG